MALDLDKMSENLKKVLEDITEKDIEKYFSKNKTPKGWISIEEKLPEMHAIDILQGYTFYKVKDINGFEFSTMVSDHDTWYHIAKEKEITHWWNE